jgi:hypothetical protein
MDCAQSVSATKSSLDPGHLVSSCPALPYKGNNYRRSGKGGQTRDGVSYLPEKSVRPHNYRVSNEVHKGRIGMRGGFERVMFGSMSGARGEAESSIVTLEFEPPRTSSDESTG